MIEALLGLSFPGPWLSQPSAWQNQVGLKKKRLIEFGRGVSLSSEDRICWTFTQELSISTHVKKDTLGLMEPVFCGPFQCPGLQKASEVPHGQCKWPQLSGLSAPAGHSRSHTDWLSSLCTGRALRANTRAGPPQAADARQRPALRVDRSGTWHCVYVHVCLCAHVCVSCQSRQTCLWFYLEQPALYAS